MALPADIKQLVDAAVAAVDSASDHQLRPILRSRLYEALAAKPPVGLRARIWLDVFRAHLTIWTLAKKGMSMARLLRNTMACRVPGSNRRTGHAPPYLTQR